MPPPPPPPHPPPRNGHVTLPYYSGLTEPMARMMRSKGLTTSISTRGSLREILVKPKDKLDKEDLTGVQDATTKSAHAHTSVKLNEQLQPVLKSTPPPLPTLSATINLP